MSSPVGPPAVEDTEPAFTADGLEVLAPEALAPLPKTRTYLFRQTKDGQLIPVKPTTGQLAEDKTEVQVPANREAK